MFRGTGAFCAAVALLMLSALGGCGASSGGGGGSPGRVGPDVLAARALAQEKTLFSGQRETSLMRSDERYLRRESVLRVEPFMTVEEFDAYFYRGQAR